MRSPFSFGLPSEKVELRLGPAPAHDIRERAARTARERPPERAVSRIEEEVGVFRSPDEREIARRGRPQPRPEMRAFSTTRQSENHSKQRSRARLQRPSFISVS